MFFVYEFFFTFVKTDQQSIYYQRPLRAMKPVEEYIEIDYEEINKMKAGIKKRWVNGSLERNAYLTLVKKLIYRTKKVISADFQILFSPVNQRFLGEWSILM